MKIILFISFVILSMQKSWAYPTYIRLNYNSCQACHQSIEGGGPLTSYGKGIAHAESFSGGEYKPGEQGLMEQSVQARVMALQRLYEYNGKKTRIFPMQLDYTNVVRWQKNLRQEVTLAVAPPNAKKSSWTDRIYARTFKLDYSIDKLNHLVLGGSNLPLGLHLVDHTSYVRERNRLGVTDVPLQLQYLKLSKTWQQTYLFFAPNPTDGDKNREYGFSDKQEFFPTSNTAAGLQVLIAKGKSIDRHLFGVFSKLGNGPWSVLSEVNFTKRILVDSKMKFDQWTSIIEGDYFFKEYLRSSVIFQTLRVNLPFKEKEELYSFNNEFKFSPHLSFILEYRQKSTDQLLEKMIFGQIFLNWW